MLDINFHEYLHHLTSRYSLWLTQTSGYTWGYNTRSYAVGQRPDYFVLCM